MNLKKLRRRLKKKSIINPIIVNKLNEICDELDYKYNINNGGCCFVAFVLMDLLKHDGYNVKLEVYSCYYLDNIRSIKDLHQSNSHYCVKIGKHRINQSNFNHYSYLNTYIINNINTKDLFSHYLANDWNDQYDIKHNAHVVEILKKEYFNISNDLYKRRHSNNRK